MKYEFHELAELFPSMTDEEFSDLKSSIEKNGLLQPIVLYERKILDGKNRYLACEDVGVKPTFTEYAGNDPLMYVVAVNYERRHLTSDQKVAIAADIAQSRTEAEAAQDANRKKNGQSEGPNQALASKPTIKAAAKMLHADKNKASEARWVKEAAEAAGTPEVFDDVKKGKASLKDAAHTVKVNEFKARNRKPIDLTDIEEENLAKAREMGIVKSVKKAGLLGLVGGIELTGDVEYVKNKVVKISENIASLTLSDTTVEYLDEFCDALDNAAATIRNQLNKVPDTVPEDWS